VVPDVFTLFIHRCSHRFHVSIVVQLVQLSGVHDFSGADLVLKIDQVLHFSALNHVEDISLVLIHGLHAGQTVVHLRFHGHLVLQNRLDFILAPAHLRASLLAHATGGVLVVENLLGELGYLQSLLLTLLPCLRVNI